MPEEREEILYREEFTESEMEIIHLRYIPEVMEEKWFIFTKGDWLFLHWSWTGHCIYMVRFEKIGEIFQVAQAFVNRNEEQRSPGNGQDDAMELTSIIRLLLLGQYIPFPRKNGDSDTDHALHMWSLVGKAMIPDGHGHAG